MDSNNFDAYRREFPVAERLIYLDHSGVAPVSLRVKKAIEVFLTESAEGGAFHYPQWAQQVVDIRSASARLIRAESNEIAFVKSTSHGLSIVAQGLDWTPGDNMLVYEKEFPSNIYPWINLKSKGVEIRVIPSREGRIELADVENLINSRTRLLAISSVQFMNGFRTDLKALGELCRRRNVLFCVDAIQSLGVIPMDVRAYHIDFLSADAHKWLMGPEGIGIFFCRQELAERLHPPLIGWKSVKNEFAFESIDFELKVDALRFEEGSMNLMGIIGLGAALELLFAVGVDRIEERVLELGDRVITEAEARGHRVLTPRARQSRGGNVTFQGNFHPGKVMARLREQGIIVNVRSNGLRVSPHFYNTEAELERFFMTLDTAVKQLLI